jgi:hypothetical protein
MLVWGPVCTELNGCSCPTLPPASSPQPGFRRKTSRRNRVLS